jgi:hypothetical protein
MVTKKLNKIGKFHLKGTFENNLFLNEKRCKTLEATKLKKEKKRKENP